MIGNQGFNSVACTIALQLFLMLFVLDVFVPIISIITHLEAERISVVGIGQKGGSVEKIRGKPQIKGIQWVVSFYRCFVPESTRLLSGSACSSPYIAVRIRTNNRLTLFFNLLNISTLKNRHNCCANS